jgi:hypothetical protein
MFLTGSARAGAIAADRSATAAAATTTRLFGIELSLHDRNIKPIG